MSKKTAKAAAPTQGATTTAKRHIEHDMLLAALPHPVLVLAEQGRLLYANAAAESFFQASAAVLKRQTLDEIIAFGSPLLALVDQVRRTGATVNEYAVDLGSPKIGANKLVDIYGGPLPDQPGLIVLMLQHRAMAQMIERQFTHRAAARSVSGMATVLAHEIKNPLAGIKGAAQLLEASLKDEDRILTQLICSETDRICNLVDDMEVFGDERPIPKDSVNVHDVLDHVKRLAESSFGRDIKIVEDYDPSLPPVPGSRDQLVQALLNLVKNACEAIALGRQAGRITLSTAFRPGVRLSLPGTAERVSLPLMIEVEDNGPGIIETMRPNLFDPFVTSKRQGKGLGLALVAKIIGDHGGTIECETRSKRTIFRILLPMQDADQRR